MGPINLSIRGNRARRTGAPPIPAFLTIDGTFRRKTSAARANEDAMAETPPPEQLPRFVNLVSFIFLHSTHGTTSNLPHLPHASPNRYPVPQICAAPAIRIHPCHPILGCHVTPQFNHARRNPTASTPIPPRRPQFNHARPNCPSHRCHVMRAETLRFNHAATIQLCPFNVLYMPLLYYIMLLL